MNTIYPIPTRKPTLLYSVAVGIALFCSSALTAQSPILAFSTSYVSAPSSVSSYIALPASPGSFSSCLTKNFVHTFSNGAYNKLRMVSFTANAQTYMVSSSTPSVVKLRRVNNSSATGNRSIVFLESATEVSSCPLVSTLRFKTPYIDDMQVALNSNALNWGTDNLFANTGNTSGNNNNIERVDVVYPSGLSTPTATAAGFAIFERGNNNAHDPFRIAAILSINASGDPTAFGPVKTCAAGGGSSNGSWGHPSTANGNMELGVNVLRKDPAELFLRVSADINQEFGGVFFSFADLGVAANQTIYGYALLGADGVANPTSTQLLNINNTAVYPTNTPESTGGLDLIAVTGTFSKSTVLALPVRNQAGAPIAEDVAFRLNSSVISLNQPVEITGAKSGQYNAALHDITGVSHRGKLVVSGSTATLQLAGYLSTGRYYLTISNLHNQSLLSRQWVYVR